MKYDFKLDLVYNNSLSLIAKHVKRESIVLEFGPANGRLTRYMSEELECKVYLVEIDEEAGKEALEYGQDLLVGDIEDYEWLKKYYDIKFDYIIFADVLEHLSNPTKVLQKTKLLLKEEGSVLLSVPNVAHNSVVINLLNNKFEYTDVGLLDNTHIHFFTKDSLEKMVIESGYVVAKRLAAYNEVGENEIQNSYDSVEGISPDFWRRRPYGNVYQYIYELKGGKEYLENQINEIETYRMPYFIKFFFDKGEGFGEEQVASYRVSQFGTQLHYEFELTEETEKVRVQFAEGSCMVENVSCCFIAGEKTENLFYSSSNLDALEGGQYYFFNKNAAVDYDLPKKEGKLIFEVSFITMDIVEINHRYDTMIKVKSMYNN